MANHITEPSAEQHTITLWEMALLLEVQNGTLSRWVKQWMKKDSLAEQGERRGRGLSLPAPYVLVGRGWKLSNDKQTREVMLRILPSDPKPWLVVVGNRGTTCYTAEQAADEARNAMLSGVGMPGVVSVFHLGEPPTN